ncbi:MAG: hypothetical protein KAJ10_10915 [Thermodesulfovibrionia bacterium]|nr:hypothetical protein [Thermodesulfovibrionia bacterium]
MREQLSEEIKIDVAGICISVRLSSPHLINQVRTNYSKFLSTREPSFALDINLTDEVYVNDSSRAGLAISGSRIEISDDYLEGRIDMALGKGSATITSSSNGFTIGFGTLLRNIFLLLLLLQDRTVALHAAAILKEGKVYIFIGASKSGKTTVARLSEEYTVLSDDLVLIKPTNGSYGVFPTPCWLDMQTGDRENRHYQIGGIFKIVQDDKTYVKKIAPAKAMAEIFTLPHIPAEFQPVQKLFGIFDGILKEFGLYELHFLKDKSFWRHVDGVER